MTGTGQTHEELIVEHDKKYSKPALFMDLLHSFDQPQSTNNFKKIKGNFKTKMLNSYASGNLGTRRSSQSCAMVVFKLLWDLCFPDLHFVKICPQKANGAQNQGTSELLN
jgi:hypothetical protein